MKTLTSIICMILGCGILAGIVALEISVWNECRVDYSFFYCLKLVSK